MGGLPQPVLGRDLSHWGGQSSQLWEIQGSDVPKDSPLEMGGDPTGIPHSAHKKHHK